MPAKRRLLVNSSLFGALVIHNRGLKFKTKLVGIEFRAPWGSSGDAVNSF